MDIHEPIEIKALLENRGVKVDIQDLKIGDYLIGSLVIERKTMDDYIRSIQESRYWDQLYNMMKNYDKRVVYLIGKYPRHIPYKANRMFDLHKFLVSTMCVSYYAYQVPVIQVYSNNEFIDHLVVYHNKYGAAKPSLRPLHLVKKKRTMEEVRSDIFCTFDGIGRKMGDSLAKKYSLYEFFNLSLTEMKDVKIGKRKLGKIGERIYCIVHHSPRQDNIIKE
jgi:ERCC4-type nuclease